MKPSETIKYDVVGMRHGVPMGIVETFEDVGNGDYDEWFATMCCIAAESLAMDNTFIDEYAIVRRTDEDRGHCHGICICRISA